MPASTLASAPAPPSRRPPQRLPTPPLPSFGILFLFALIGIALAYEAYTRTRRSAPQPAAAIRTATAAKGTLRRTLRITGMTVAGSAASLVTPRLTGRRSRSSTQGDFRLTLKYLISPGTKVKAGDLVAEFDRQFMELRLDDLAADVRSRELALETVRTNLTVNRKAYDQRILAAEGAVSKARLDLRTIAVRSAIVSEQYKLNLEEAEARLKQLRAESRFFDISETAANRRQELELQEEQLDLHRSQRNNDRMRILAPISGVFVPQRVRRGGEYKDIQAGDDLTPGAVIGDIHDTSQLIVEAALNQADIHLIRPGLAATLHAEAFPDLSMPAEVMRIGSLAQSGGARAEYVRNIPLRLRVLGTDPRLMPNYTVTADVAIASLPGAILIPREALFSSLNDNHVFVRSNNGWRWRSVSVAAMNHFQVAVASDVTQGEVVALEAPKLLQ
jgi:HlyD family secretion protein